MKCGWLMLDLSPGASASAAHQPSLSEAPARVQIVRTSEELALARAELDGTLALVPTMGALHAGHLALVAEGKRRADKVAASIFVNPLQFGANEDLARYPRREAEDAQSSSKKPAATCCGCRASRTSIRRALQRRSASPACRSGGRARSRPGHFDGVATVVAKLLFSVRPDVAIFGEKDFQQLAVIRRMVADLAIPVEIVGAPTVREANGLALSSRNAYLSADERAQAVALPRALEKRARRHPRGRKRGSRASNRRSKRWSTPAFCASIMSPWSMPRRWSRSSVRKAKCA